MTVVDCSNTLRITSDYFCNLAVCPGLSFILTCSSDFLYTMPRMPVLYKLSAKSQIKQENRITMLIKRLPVTHLDFSNFSNNELTQLPWELRKWRMLTHLKLSKNELSFLHKSFHTMFNQLEVLEVSYNQLISFCIQIEDLKIHRSFASAVLVLISDRDNKLVLW